MLFLMAALLAVALYMLLLFWWGRLKPGFEKTILFAGLLALSFLFSLWLLASGRGFFALIPLLLTGWQLYRPYRDKKKRHKKSQQASGFKPVESRAEALAVLGLQEGASPDEIQAAYKRLMALAHPDKGGSDWMAAQINQARQILLKDR